MLYSVVVAALIVAPTPTSTPWAHPPDRVDAEARLSFGGLSGQLRQDPLRALREGIGLVEQGDYAAAIEVLEAAAIELEAERATPRDRAQSWFYAGIARLFVVGDEQALLAFQQAREQDPLFRPAATDFPRRVMRLWDEATASPSPEPAAGAAGTLTVVTNPAGAMVYIEGRPRGRTPVGIEGLSAGVHRVTLVRANRSLSRTVRLAPDQAEHLEVLLPPEPEGQQERRTSAATSASTSQQDQMEEESGGSGWWRWAAIAAGGGAAAYLLVPKNKPPVASASVTPVGAGMAGVTEYRFDGSRSSDPDNDRLTYSWNFGDGGAGSGVTATHVYDRPGSYSATLTVSDGKEQATTTNSVTVARNLDGGRFASSRLGISGTTIDIRVSIRLNQDGSRLGGSATFSGDVRGTLSVSGSLSSSNRFVCPCRVSLSGASELRLTGTVDNGANVIDGDFSFVVSTSQGRVRLRWSDIAFTRQ